MSAIIAVRGSNSVHMLTDGAGTMPPDNRLYGTATKAWPLPHLPAILAFRSKSTIASMLLLDFFNMAAQSYDELRDTIEGRLVEWVKPGPHDAAFGWSENPEIDIMIGGWSARSGPDSFMVTTSNIHISAGLKPLTVCDLAAISALPANDATYDDLGVDANDGDAFDPVRDGVAMMKEQRKLACPVGGFIQLTSLTEHEITTRIVHRWPDKIGEPIVP